MEPVGAPPPERLEIEIEGDEEEAVEALHAWGLTDGLPVVAPTRERVDRLCAGAHHYPMESLGRLAPREGEATLQKVAINAVMAGCLPEHMPVLEAAIEAIQKPDFNLIGMQTTTHPCALLCIVQGPVVDALGMNAEIGCMGPGCRANASIGRALRLVLQNIGGAIAGKTDKSTQGSPAKYGFCFPENESASPWPPLRTTLGFEVEQSCVTLASAEGPHNVNDHGSTSGEAILATIAETMATVGSNNLYVGGDHFVVLGPEHAEGVAKAGFSREDVQAFLYEKARVHVDRIGAQKLEELTSWGGYADKLGQWGGRIPLAREPDLLRVLVAGGAGKHSCWIPTFGVGFAQSARIQSESDVCRI